MSLYIDVDKVAEVLLADGWHTVADNSFDLDSYEFHHQNNVVHGGGNYGVCATGFIFTDPDGRVLAGPLTAILAVNAGRVPQSAAATGARLMDELVAERKSRP